MYAPRQTLEVPSEFGFPYKPYGIQQELMQALFKVLESKQIGIFESPTGTGKSLTLTCAALTWLQAHEQLVRDELQQRLQNVQGELSRLLAASEQAADWLTAQSAILTHREELCELQQLQTLLQQKEAELKAIKQRCKQQPKRGRAPQRNSAILKEQQIEVDDLIAQPAEEQEEEEDEEQEKETLEEQQTERFRDVKIFFCSRTHAQLSQILTELRKTRHAQTVRCIALGSRQQLCVNAQVRRLNNAALMNERCLDMANVKERPLQSKVHRLSKQTLQRCSFKTQDKLQLLSDTALCEPLDIEELAKEASSCQSCAYYAARAAQQHAQLVLLPYPLLLQRRARQQLGIDIRGAVIIVDEAHNLLDSIAQLHSCELSLAQLQQAHNQIFGYKQRYMKRMAAAGLLRINQLIFIIQRLIKVLSHTSGGPRMVHTYELSAEGDFFNIDLFVLLQFCERTRVAQKLQGFARQEANEDVQPMSDVKITPRMQLLQHLAGRAQNEPAAKPVEAPLKSASTPPTSSPIRPVLAFLETLTSNAADGRVLINTQAGSFKYLLLNPAEHFQEIVKEARAIVIAGGTMQPTQELTEQLFRDCPERVVQYYYDHVVPPDAVLPFVVSHGPRGMPLCFNYKQRNNTDMLNELSMLLQNLCNVVPAGVICFLPSYEYLETVYAHLEKVGALARIGQRKRVFRETPGSGVGDGGVEKLLQEYAMTIKQSHGGALLLSVVGGKLSEGLNFADDLGRGVIVVGLPYPNRNAPELQERMRHLDVTLGTGAGSEYYENLCMKAVNQCIGRSVRHILDYACVYLLDERYVSVRIQQKLPAWISKYIVVGNSANGGSGYGIVQARTARFFKASRD